MAKYIDVDRLKAEIKRLKLEVYDEAHQFDLGARGSLKYLEDFIDSLQHEQPEVDIVMEYDEQFYSDPVYRKLANRYAGVAIARHFYELGKNSK